MFSPTYHTVDKLDIPRTLTIAVPRAILGTRLVPLILGQSAILVHRHKVQRPVQPTANLGHVHIKRELVAQQRKHLVLGLVLHQVQPAADVLAVGPVGDKLDAQLVPGRGDAVRARVVGAVEAAVLGAGLAGGADGGVPFVAAVAVRRGVCEVRPSPVGVDDDGALRGGAAGGGAFGPGEGGVGFGGEGAGLLGLGGGDEGEGGDE